MTHCGYRNMDLNKRLREWAQMASQSRGSGKTVDVWCKEHGISRKTYYYRLRGIYNMIPELVVPWSSAIIYFISQPYRLCVIELIN
jgi:hypothetical protein